MERVAAFIDGFNFYHSLEEAGCQHLKWLNYWNLADAFVANSREKLVKVFYFSAIVPWDQAKAARHKVYIQALEFYGVEIVLGKFKEVTKKCRAICHQKYNTYEEKETDVNIAVTLLSEAVNDTYDRALLFSGDSDMIAGVRALKKLCPHKKITAVIPYMRSSVDLINNCHSSAKIKKKHLENNQFPPRIELKPGSGAFITRPAAWPTA